MAAKTIPHFLLPRRSLIWQPLKLHQAIRHASTRSKPKSNPKPSLPKVLEKPSKFNPPSHGSKLRQPGGPKITNYGPHLSQAELASQSKKQYPNSLPPPGTFLHWFIHSRAIHIYISLGTLTTLAVYTFYTSLKDDAEFEAKYGDMLLPLFPSVFTSPIAFWRGCFEVVRLRGLEKSEETRLKRERNVNDVRKRDEFRKKHGLETEGFGGWTWKGDAKVGKEEVAVAAVAKDGEGVLAGDSVGVVEEKKEEEKKEEEKKEEERPKKVVKKWLGIW